MLDHERSNREAVHNGYSNGHGGALAGFIAGAAIGAGVALLLAPSSGAETQRRIGHFARKVKDGIGHGADKAASEIGAIKGDVRAAVSAGKEAFREERDARRQESARPQI